MFGQPADPEILKGYEDAGASRAMVFADSAPRGRCPSSVGRLRTPTVGITMLSENANILSLRDANQRFYDAFGSLDMEQDGLRLGAIGSGVMCASGLAADCGLARHPPVVAGDIQWRGVDALQYSLCERCRRGQLRLRDLRREHHQRGGGAKRRDSACWRPIFL